MSIKPITPSDVTHIEMANYDLDHIIQLINEDIIKNHGMYHHEEAILHTEYPISVRKVIAIRLYRAGWKYVYHMTSSENGERPGLTCFILSTKPVSENIVRKYTLYKPS